ncbi:elongator complex protein 2 [Nymphaea colorata]|nr:elongator complex protein 2 [Nymphaea colorata]XP_031477274.1 elongator complex protein 2 [Nymphaea colorata]
MGTSDNCDMRVSGVDGTFIGAGCNRVVNNVSWGACNLVAFGAQNAVAIFCPEKGRILTTLPGHKALVNCTCWIPSSKDVFKVQTQEHFLLSGGADGVILMWAVFLKEMQWMYVMQVPKSHGKGVTCITGLLVSEGASLFASTGSDGIVFLWKMDLPSSYGDGCEMTCLDSISVGMRPMVALSLASLPENPGQLVLAMGGLDNKIHLYSGEGSGKLSPACELKGHTDWIRGLDFSLPISVDGGSDFLFLASSSQDKTIRVWRIALRELPSNAQATSIQNCISMMSYIEGPVFTVADSTYQVSLESLLVGHDDWVYSVDWQPALIMDDSKKGWIQPQSILSASMDKTMMIWKPEKNTGIWTNMVSVGELSHSALGFYGGHWGPHGDSILAHGYGGSFHLWKNVGSEQEKWQPKVVPSGHSGTVTDFSWSRSGEYILSVSHDQTTRIFASWESKRSSGEKPSWHEIARPQVHGHDINCVTVIQGKGNQRFVSGADEKVARVFSAPLSFLKTLRHASAQMTSYLEDTGEDVQILGANMSALGLSQKPIYVHSEHNTAAMATQVGSEPLETIPDAVPIELMEPPIEEQLAWHTLWPETHKLYGHGNELFSLCCDHEGKLVASSCKAQSAKVAEIWLWQVGSWKGLDRLQSHSLTVTQMEFSPDDSFLLAVSRDRHFSLFSITRDGLQEVSHKLVAKIEAHKRIIWACSWNPHGHQFATGSRDKTVKIWTVIVSPDEEACVKQLMVLPQFASSVTALSWSGGVGLCNGLLAIGMEDGLIELWSTSTEKTASDSLVPSKFSARPAFRLHPFLCHASTVHRLAWRKNHEEDTGGEMTLQLGSCGADHTVRVFDVKISNF